MKGQCDKMPDRSAPHKDMQEHRKEMREQHRTCVTSTARIT